jgi:uncharacterized protein YkwD
MFAHKLLFPMSTAVIQRPARSAPRRRGPPRALAVALVLLTAVLAARGPVSAADEATRPGGQFAEQMLALMNQERTAVGLPALVMQNDRSEVAGWRSDDMASRGYFAHVNPDGIGAPELLDQYPIVYRVMGENIARSTYPADQVIGIVHRALMASEGHRANVLEPRFGRVGIAAARTGDTFYVTVIFTD